MSLMPPFCLAPSSFSVVRQVVFEDIVVAVLGVRLLRQEFKAVTRLWAMTYLDEDLRYNGGLLVVV